MRACVSNVHVEPVPGTVYGMFHNPYNPANDQPTTYCQVCADTGEAFGMFTPSTEDPEGRALVQRIIERKKREAAPEEAASLIEGEQP